MPSVLNIKEGVEEGLRLFLESLLKDKKVSGVFTLRKTNEEGAAAYTLITDPELMRQAVPLYPLMPVNAGKALSSYTLDGASQAPLAAVVRPCELRAFSELVKREQGHRDNLLLISVSCGGVFPIGSLSNGTLTQELPAYWKAAQNAEIPTFLRPTCAACEHFLPFQADITVGVMAQKDLDKECNLFLHTQKAEDMAAGAPGSITSGELETPEIQAVRTARAAQRQKLFEPFAAQDFGLSGLVQTFAPCLSCHGCSYVCPICYCTLCDFDSKTHEYQPTSYSIELDQKGGMRIPPGTLFFHTGRMVHMAVSCVNCGMCSDVCPVNIPVATIFSKVGDALAEEFEYVAGKDAEEPLPLGTYKVDEYSDVGE